MRKTVQTKKHVILLAGAANKLCARWAWVVLLHPHEVGLTHPSWQCSSSVTHLIPLLHSSLSGRFWFNEFPPSQCQKYWNPLLHFLMSCCLDHTQGYSQFHAVDVGVGKSSLTGGCWDDSSWMSTFWKVNWHQVSKALKSVHQILRICFKEISCVRAKELGFVAGASSQHQLQP